jgi:hypothetical protein
MKLFKPKHMTWIFIVSAATAILALISGYLQYKEKIESSEKSLKKEEEINRLNTQIIQELKGGDLPIGEIRINTDGKRQFIDLLIDNLSDLPIYFIGAEIAEPESSKTDFVEYPENVFQRIERNVLQPGVRWYSHKKYLTDTVEAEFRVVFRIYWRMDSYIGQAKFEKGPDGFYQRASLEYFYKKAVYTDHEFHELALSKEKKFKSPFLGY